MNAAAAPAPSNRRIPPSVVLLASASVLALLGRSQLALAGFVFAIVGQQLAWLYPAQARQAARAVDDGIARLGHALSTGLFGLVHVVLIVPAWAIRGRRVLRRETAWRPMPNAPSEPAQLHAGAPAHGQRPGRGIDALVGAVLVLAAVGLARLDPPSEAVADSVTDRATATAQLAPALADQPRVGEELAEQGQVFADRVADDELGWVLGDSTGELVQVRDGERVTPVPQGAGADPLVVWFFGGSQTWGLGDGDDATIPARFAARATEEGRPVAARNFAVPAYLVGQSSKLLVRELARQSEEPDLIVFVDGYNETVGGLASTLAGVAPGEPFTAYGASGAAGTGAAYDGPAATLDERYDGVLAMHALGRDRAQRAADAAGVPIVFAWQPNAFSGPLRPTEGEVLTELSWADDELAALRTADAAVRSRLPDDVIDLGSVFDGVEEPIYWDTVHVNEMGADLIARALLDDLSDRLDSLEGDR